MYNYVGMPTRSFLGEFEHLVLLAVLRLGDDAFPPAVLEEIAARTGREASRGAVYITLDRLEEKGMLQSTAEPGPPERGGRPRRRLQLSHAGLAALRDSRDALMSLWDGVEQRLGRA